MSEELEARIREHFDRNELQEAATVALDGYGGEVLGFLIATMRSEQDASEVFSQLGEDLWRGLPRFEWRSSFRTWLYTLARHASVRFRKVPQNQQRRRVRISEIGEVTDQVRSRTLPYLRTEVKDRFAELRESLDPADQAILILRINRGLTWKEIAVVLKHAAENDEAALVQGAARLRQRFRGVRERLHAEAQRQGLLDVDD